MPWLDSEKKNPGGVFRLEEKKRPPRTNRSRRDGRVAKPPVSQCKSWYSERARVQTRRDRPPQPQPVCGAHFIDGTRHTSLRTQENNEY